MDCILYAFQRFNNLNVKHEHMATLDASSYRDVWEEGDGEEEENICEIRLKIVTQIHFCQLLNACEPFIYAGRFMSEHRQRH